jgi:hypothetical protein
VPPANHLELSTASKDAQCFTMQDRPLTTCHPVPGESADRIAWSLAAEDKTALGKIADEKKVNIGYG